MRYAQVEAMQYAYVAGHKELQTKHTALTNDRGEYRIFYLPPGRYYLRAQATQRSSPRLIMMRGHNNDQVRGTLPASTVAAAYYPGVAAPARATELQAQPGSELDGIDFTLAPEKLYSIRGKFPADAKARRSVRLIERLETERRPLDRMVIGPDSYEIDNVAPGSYFVVGDAIDPTNPEVRQYARQPVEIVDRDLDGVDLEFAPGVRVTGAVLVEGPAVLPKTNLGLFLQLAGSEAREQAKVSEDGTFSSIDIEPGIYQFALARRNAYLKSILVGGHEAPGGKIDTAHLSDTVTVVIGTDFGRVEGTVTDETGKPVYNAAVTLIPDQSHFDWQERFLDAFTSTAGKFTFTNVEPGEYKAFAWQAVEPGAAQSADFRKPYENRGVTIKVEANGIRTVALKLIVP